MMRTQFGRTKPGQSRTTSGHIGTVAASYVLTLLEVVARRGADRDGLLARAGMRPEVLEIPSARVPVLELLELFDVARQVTSDPLLGLHMGQEAKPRTFSALGYAAMGAATLEEAMELIPRYERIVYDGGHTTVSRSRDVVEIRWRSGLDSLDGARLRPLNEAIVAGWLSFGRWITDLRAEVVGVRFQHANPGNRKELDEYDAFFGCPIEFDAEDDALLFPATLLRQPVVHRDEALRAAMERRAAETLRELDEGRPLTHRAASVVRERLARGVPTIAEVGRALGIGERTFRRKLVAEGQSFRDLLSEVRRELAIAYLKDPSLTLLDVTLLLGYADQSAFSAAFSAWFGESPSAARGRV